MKVSSAAVRRAAVLIAVGLALAVTCTFLGRWQWHRHVWRDALIATVQANWAAPAVPLATVVPSVDDDPVASDEWRSVAVTGHYLPDSAVLLRNRPVNGSPAYHVLVPFQVDGGGLLVVDRGWVPLGDDAQKADGVPAPPAGTVDLVVRLRVPEAASARSAPPGQVQAIAPAQVLTAGGAPASDAYRWYGGLVSESPAAATALGALATPSTDPGPHLSYAVQWWVFAIAGLAAFGWLARREILDDLAGRAPVGTARRAPGDADRPAPVGAAEPAPVGAARPEVVVAQPDRPDRAQDPRVPSLTSSSARRSQGRPGAHRRARGADELAEDALIDSQSGE